MKLIILLLICNLYCQTYNRKYFKHWQDIDSDCQNTRQESLIENSLVPVRFNNDSCTVLYGLWYCPFSDSLIHDPKIIDIDHIIPLKNVYYSGGHKWSKERKEEYSNDLDVLLPVLFSQNRSKGSKSPNEWLPKNKKFYKQYCKLWIYVKNKYNLSVTKDELEFLKEVLKNERNITYPSLNND